MVATVLTTGLAGVGAANSSDSNSDDVDQEATVERDRGNDQTTFAVIDGGDRTNYNEQSQTDDAANYNG